MTGDALIHRYDAALFDLDGVIYLGPSAVPGAAAGIARLKAAGVKVGYVTNNAARAPRVVAQHLRDLGVPADDTDVVTSAQAGAQLLVNRFGPGAKVLVVGGEGILAALDEAGLLPVHSADDSPVAVIQGFAFDLTWSQLNEAAIAIQRGAHWLATNTDSTRPTDRGIVPGNGAAVEAVRTAVLVDPEVAGKPFRPLLDVTVARLGARCPIFVGDRIDTDIAGAAVVGLDSLFVLTGAHGPRELLTAPRGSRPTHLGWDLAALLAPARLVERRGDLSECGRMRARYAGGRLSTETPPQDTEEVLDLLWAVAHLSWQVVDEGGSIDVGPVLEAFAGLR